MTDAPRIITTQDRATFWIGEAADMDPAIVNACTPLVPMIVKDDTLEPDE